MALGQPDAMFWGRGFETTAAFSASIYLQTHICCFRAPYEGGGYLLRVRTTRPQILYNTSDADKNECHTQTRHATDHRATSTPAASRAPNSKHAHNRPHTDATRAPKRQTQQAQRRAPPRSNHAPQAARNTRHATARHQTPQAARKANRHQAPPTAAEPPSQASIKPSNARHTTHQPPSTQHAYMMVKIAMGP